METVKVFNKTNRQLVWFDVDLDGPPMEPMQWTEGVPEVLARTYAVAAEVSVDWNSNNKRRIMRPQPFRTSDGREHLLLAIPVSSRTGYGYLSMKLGEALAQDKNLHLSTHSLAQWSIDSLSDNFKDVLGQDQEICEWALAVTLPTELPNIPARHIVLYSMWETRELPRSDQPDDHWAQLCNNWAEALIVPCEEQKQLFERAGVTIPIYVVPIGLDTDVYKPKYEPKSELFTIWCHGRLTSRKSPMELMTEVCWPALGEFDDWELIFKTWGDTLGGGKFFPVIQDDRIMVINEPQTPDEMCEMMNRAHVGVYLSKYEGWGMPFREAMASSMVTIPSRTSGHIVDCDPRYNFGVEIVDDIDAGDGYPGSWDLPNWHHARAVILGLYETWKAGKWDQVTMGRDASEWVRKNRTWDKMAVGVMDAVNETHDRVKA